VIKANEKQNKKRLFIMDFGLPPNAQQIMELAAQ